MIETAQMRQDSDKKAGDVFRVLIVDDEQLFAQAIGRELKRHGITCDLAYNAEEAISLSRSGYYQAILLDHKLPDDDGIRIIPLLLGRQLKSSLIMMTAYETIQNAIQAIRRGAEDYIVKQTSIKPIINRVLEIRKKHHVRKSTSDWEDQKKEGPLGESPGIRKLREKIVKLSSRRDTTVLFSGETGVGKEVAARHLHALSTTGASPFISVDCVALPDTLVESLLFGHEKGAFTGADHTKEGAFFEAQEGTILLDEIGDMDLALQGKLLRVLETRHFQRVGSVKEYPVKARVIAATNQDLSTLVSQGRFRFDLHQRISIFPISIPPLRQRANDILLLAGHFLDFFCSKMGYSAKKLPPDVQEMLLQYDYPGNVRELKNIMERAVILADSGKIEPRHLPERLVDRRAFGLLEGSRASAHAVDFIPGIDTLETLEKKLIHQALQQTKGVKGEAAKMLGISRFQLLRRMEKYRLNPPGRKSRRK